MDARLIFDSEDYQKSLLENYELGLQSGNAELQDPKVYLALMEDLCSVIQKAANHKKAMAAARERASSNEEFQQIYEAELSKEESKEETPKNSIEYKAFENRLLQMKNLYQSHLNSDIDEEPENTAKIEHVQFEEVIMEAQINLFDPITKKRMIEPMRNKLCGHHYEQSSIEQLVRDNPKLRCPVAGCGNKQFVRMEDLTLDVDFKMRLTDAVEMIDESNDDIL